MARRVPLAALALAAAVLAAAAAPPARATDAATVLVRYGFDDDDVATGPDTFAVFRAAHGRVGLSSAYHLSGYRAVEIRDAAGNGDFSELQGYFPQQREGHVFAHFALLTARPEEELNVALAGPRRFRLGPDGIAFWLATREGRFVHVSDSIPKKLAPVRGFVWYTVDVAYDVAAGRYDLTIREEGQREPVVALKGQPGAASQKASAVDVFSFISDPVDDASDVAYYVDDVSISTSREVVVPPLVAPGRRKLFVDAFAEYRRLQESRIRCLPAASLVDLGLEPHDLADPGALSAVADLLAGEDGPVPPGLAGARVAAVRAAAEWRRGCLALDEGRAADALSRFEGAAALAGRGRLYGLSAVLALAALARHDAAEDRLAAIAPEWADDPRLAIVSARLASARGDTARAQETLRAAAERGDARAAERYYSALVWDARWREAGELASAWARRATGVRRADWLERAGDAAFQAGEAAVARDLYEEAGRIAPAAASAFLKLADVAFVLQDLEAERRYRERYFGTLEGP
jgi:hypothetical protein